MLQLASLHGQGFDCPGASVRPMPHPCILHAHGCRAARDGSMMRLQRSDISQPTAIPCLLQISRDVIAYDCQVHTYQHFILRYIGVRNRLRPLWPLSQVRCCCHVNLQRVRISIAPDGCMGTHKVWIYDVTVVLMNPVPAAAAGSSKPLSRVTVPGLHAAHRQHHPRHQARQCSECATTLCCREACTR